MNQLVLADGTKIDAATGGVVRDPIVYEAPPPRVRLKLSELGASTKQLNAMAVLMVYSTLGVSVEEIATAMSTEVSVLEKVQASSLYQKLCDDLLNAVIDNDADNVRTILAAHAKPAALELAQQLKSCTEEIGRREVARDILDRAGFRPADVVEHRHTVEGGLKIEYVEREKPIDINIEVL